MEEKILEIINSKLHPMAGHSWLIGCDKSDNEISAKEIASHFREFIEWILTGNDGNFIQESSENNVNIIFDYWGEKRTLDELYNFWLKEVKK